MTDLEPCVDVPVLSRSDTRFILVGVSHPGNVGAAARAMRVMGFRDLVLVAPRLPDVLRHPKAVAMASGALDILRRAEVVGSLSEAACGVTHLCATAMTPRDFGPPTHAPRVFFQSLAATPHRLGLVFGTERHGLSNEDVYQCHAALSIPTDPAYGSLNLSQAVQLLAYEWRQACGGFEVRPRTAPPQWADATSVAGVLSHWEQALVQIDFLKPEAPGKLMPRLHQLLNRAQLTREEVHILRGIARSVLRKVQAGVSPDGPA